MKKLNVIILTMILSLVIFAGVNVMAMDEDTLKIEEPKTVISEEAPIGIEGGNTAEEVKAEEKEEIVEEGNKEASAPVEDKTTKTDVENVDMGGVPSSNIDTDKAVEPADKKPSDAKEETVEEKTSEEKAKEDDKKSEETKPEEKKDDNTKEKSEEKKQDGTKEAEGKTDEEKAEEGENTEANADAKELEVGTVLDPDKLTPLGAGPEERDNYFEVKSYDELVNAIKQAKDNVETTIVITQSFEITDTITIGENKIIVLTSGADRSKADNQVTPIGEDKITMPTENDDMARRQELVKEAEAKGEKALEDTDLTKNPLPNVEIILKRAEAFKATLFKVEKGAKLTLGKDNKDPLFIDANKDVKTEITNGSIIDVSGELTMNGGFIANSNNERTNSAPIYVHEDAKFTMNGGRITSNRNISKGHSTFNAAGAVYIDEGGEFTLNGGSIDNNEAPVGGVFLGKIFGNINGKRIKALFTMNGGLIANNKGPMYANLEPETENYGGAGHVESHANFLFNNGVLAGK